MNAAAVSLAYRHCEQVTRSRARNFYYGIRLLPPQKRRAMCALYAMARRIDDVGDSSGPSSATPATVGQQANQANAAGKPTAQSPPPAEPKALSAVSPPAQPPPPAAQLASVRASLRLVSKAAAGGPQPPPGDPVLMALADTARRFPLPLSALEELVEGCEWDIAGRRYETFEDLLGYCRRVAGTIGRLSLAIYGSEDPERAEVLADSLGVALQLTNILRDLAEDRDTYGRVYIPAEDLRRFGVGPGLDGPADNIIALVCYEAARAAEWYEQGLRLLPLLDYRSRACTAAMAGIYRRLLRRIELAPASVLAKRVSLPPVEKATVAATALVRGAA